MTARPPLVRLDARIGWRSAALAGVSARGDSLTLTPLPGTIRPLGAPSGSFAGLSTPLNVACCADGTLFILDGGHKLLRYDPCLERFTPIPCLPEMKPIAIACHPGGELLLLDRAAKRITALGLAALRIRRHWPVPGDPRDLIVLPDGRIAVSDHAADLIHIFDRRGRLCLAFDGGGGEEPPLDGPGAMAVDRQGRLYVVEEGRAAVAVIDPEHRIVARTEDAEAFRGRFADPCVAVDDDGTIWISDRRSGVVGIVRCDCAGLLLPAEPAPLVPAHCPLLAFDADGRAILGDPRSPCLSRADPTRYAGTGTALLGPLDSGQARTIWDRLSIDGEAPEGTTLAIATLATDIPLTTAEIDSRPEGEWTATPVLFDGAGPWTGAVRGAPGRWLWLRLGFVGDGKGTPVVRAIAARAPRDTSMRYLPGCFAADPASADFLARFMGLFDEARERSFAPLDRLPALFDPRSTPAAEAHEAGADFLDWLASWVGIALDRHWSVARRRRLVAEAPALFRIRGTVAGLKRHVAVYTGVEPKLVEHFRLRRWLALDEGRLGTDAALWGPEIVRRLQLDAYCEIGRFALVDGGDPLTDPIGAFAHRATLYVPVSDEFGEADQEALRQVAEAARPAHVDVDIRLMRPRFVIGCDLVLGVNTVLGRDPKPARTDESVLGEEIRLADAPRFSLTPGIRLGVDSILE